MARAQITNPVSKESISYGCLITLNVIKKKKKKTKSSFDSHQKLLDTTTNKLSRDLENAGQGCRNTYTDA